jgi:hypothetical protein
MRVFYKKYGLMEETFKNKELEEIEAELFG